jgi:hypothetical protein
MGKPKSNCKSSRLNAPSWEDELRAIGVSEEIIAEPKERFLVALKDLWASKKRMPTYREISSAANVAQGSVHGLYFRLETEGRVVRPNGRRGVYVPVGMAVRK